MVRCTMSGLTSLIEPCIGIPKQRAMDGRCGRDRYRERCLEQNVKIYQIFATYVWTTPRATRDRAPQRID